MKKILFISCLLALTLNTNLQAQIEGISSPKWVFTPEGIVDANQVNSQQLKIENSSSLLAGRTINFSEALKANENNFKNLNLIQAGDFINLPCGEDISFYVKVKNGESIWLLSKVWNKELKKITRNDSLFAKANVQLPSANVIAKEKPAINWKFIFAIIYAIVLFSVILFVSILIIRKLNSLIEKKE